MNEITLKAYAKVNLAIDVLGKRPDGYHDIHMVMEQIDLFDQVSVRWTMKCQEDVNGEDLRQSIKLSTNLDFLPTDERNIAYKAAERMAETYMKEKGLIKIHIQKNIPISAGLAGGSSNGAAVIHALNKLWNLNLSVGELMGIGAKLGADVPFCIGGQAVLNPELGLGQDPQAASCAIATGIGEKLEKIQGLNAWVLLLKPPISVSTAQVYQGLDLQEMGPKPNIEELARGMKENNYYKVAKNMVNVLESYSLKEYSVIMYTKNMILEEGRPIKALMSGSGPTVFGLFTSKAKAKAAYKKLKDLKGEMFLVELL